MRLACSRLSIFESFSKIFPNINIARSLRWFLGELIVDIDGIRFELARRFGMMESGRLFPIENRWAFWSGLYLSWRLDFISVLFREWKVKFFTCECGILFSIFVKGFDIDTIASQSIPTNFANIFLYDVGKTILQDVFLLLAQWYPIPLIQLSQYIFVSFSIMVINVLEKTMHSDSMELPFLTIII